MEIEVGDEDAPRRELNRRQAVDREKARADSTNGDSGIDGVLSDPERLVAEHRTYRASVARDYSSVQERWAEAIPELRGAWEKIKEKYGYGEHAEQMPQSNDGTWHGMGGRRLDAAQNGEIDHGYARIREVGEQTIIPGILSVESDDPTRQLAGFDRRFKGEDRLKEKVSDLLEPPPEVSAAEALGAVSDAVRFTYTYAETRYSLGVTDDVERLKARGFELEKLKNTWTSDQYKGINSQWLEPSAGVRFEVQFHTQASLEAKELSHKAYERIRAIADPSPETDREVAELEGFQSRVNSMIPIPPGVNDIDDYRREKRDA